MPAASPLGLGALITQYFPVVIAIVGTIAVALGGLSKFKEKRQADLIEATTTWRGLAESRQAALEEARVERDTFEKKFKAATERESALWEYISELRSHIPAGIAPVMMPPILRG